MAGVVVKVSERTRDTLRRLAEDEHRSMQDVLARAVEAYRRQRILDQTNEAYAHLRANQATWDEIQEERAAWDATLADGLD